MPDVKVNGMRIHYELDDFTDSWEQSDTILIQHGYGRSGKFWYHWVPPLARDYRVLRVDMRGHGQSADPDDDHPWSVDELLSDIRGVIEALGLGSVHYVGESVGGILGIALAARWPELLKSVTLVAAPLSIRPEIQEIFALGEKDWPTAMEKLGGDGWARGLMGHGAADPETSKGRVEWGLEEWAKNRPMMLASLARLAATVNVESLDPVSRDDLLERLNKIRINTTRVCQPRNIRKILLLSRVTIGADVAITSIMIQRLSSLFPEAQIVLIGAAKCAEIYSANSRINIKIVDYNRRGDFIERLSSWHAVLEIIRTETETTPLS